MKTVCVWLEELFGSVDLMFLLCPTVVCSKKIREKIFIGEFCGKRGK
jgi:hypothetical protein